MNDMRATIIPKSDQINADDLIGGPMTITVARIVIDTASEQPVSIHYEGDNGKPYMACKSMRRVLVNIWGADANVYVGRGMTLFRDAGVQFGGMAVGGIRISHMSHIDKPVTMALTATRANRKPFTVKPLDMPKPAAPKRTFADYLREKLDACDSRDAVGELVGRDPEIAKRKASEGVRAEINKAYARFPEEMLDDDTPSDDGRYAQGVPSVAPGSFDNEVPF